MKHSLNIAWFRCTCGHRSTPPDGVNVRAHEMEFYKVVEVIEPETILEGQSQRQVYRSKLLPTDEQRIKTDTEKEFKGNTVRIVQETNKKIAKFNRSYSTVKHQSSTDLIESDHIILGCPNCGKTLYEVKY